MLRALFILLAVVSFVLAIVLNMPALYVAAGILVVVSIVMLVSSAKRRHDRSKKSYLSTAPSRDHDDELAALGIGEIRPRERSHAGKRHEDDFHVMEEPSREVSSDVVPDVETVNGVTGTHAAMAADDGAHRRDEAQSSPEKQRTDAELRALGIMDIRPKNRRASSPIFDFSESPPESADSGPSNGARPVSANVVQPKPRYEDPASPEAVAARDRLRREVLLPYLQSMLSAVGANTVCLLRHDEDPLKYHIEAIVSKNAYARSQGHFRSRVPLLTPAIARRPVLTFRIGEKGLPGTNLGYYLEPIAVRQIAVTDVPGTATAGSYFLLADTMDDGGLGAPRQHALLSQFARVLGMVMGGDETISSDPQRTGVRPRRDIIEEEMGRARDEGYPLALILVYLNTAESISAEGEEAINEAEAILEGRLREAVEARRVEHFGELVYGIFYSGEPSAVEPWVMGVQERLHQESGPLRDGISIGIAILNDRHTDADAFRRDATEALRVAYESGACTILE